ncbi:MAG: serine hydrolase domain-containing protein, partial [Myxococcota bacterium]
SLGPDAEQIDRARFWERAMAAPLSRRGRFRYSNVGYSVAAIALEAATGTPHEAHLRRMMDEAGIETLRYDIPAEDRGALAIGYEGNRRWGTILDLPRVEDGPGWNLRGNGGLLATTSDVLRWRGWVAGLDSDVRERAFGMHIEQGGGLDYGYGWDVGVTSRDTQVVNHDGGNGVFYARATWWPDEDAFLFTASNRAEQPAIDFHGRLVAEVIAHLNRGAR